MRLKRRVELIEAKLAPPALGVSSRAEAIERAVGLGLLEGSRYPAIDLGR